MVQNDSSDEREIIDDIENVALIGINLVVGGSQLPAEIDLDALEEDLEGVTTRREKQPGLEFKFGEDEPLVTFHSSGKYIIRAGSQQLLIDENKKVIDMLNEMGVTDATVEDIGLEFYNYAGQGNLGRIPRLETVAIGLGLKNVIYEPEDYPAVIYYNEDYPCQRSLIYGNGKVILPGGNTAEECRETFMLLANELKSLFPSQVTVPERAVLETEIFEETLERLVENQY